MVLCAVYRCNNRSGRDKVSFFRLPSIHSRSIHNDLRKRRQNLWLKRLNRKFLIETNMKDVRVCSNHFVTGKPSDLFDDIHPDWAPSLNLGFNTANNAAICNRSEQQKLQISNNDSVDGSVKKLFSDSLAPGNPHIIRVVPMASENGKAIEQGSESVIDLLQEEKESDISEDEAESEISEDEEEKHNSLIQEEIPAKIPETEVVTYLVCDVNQKLNDIQKFVPNSSQENSVKLTENLHLKDASEISNIIQATPLVSKVVERKPRVPKVELKEKTDLVYKISLLESKIARFREQRKNNKKRISTLLQAQRRDTKKIDALQDYITVLKQKDIVAHAKSENVQEVSPSLLDLLARRKCQNKDKTAHNEYSLEVREFVKTLYSISPDAYTYIRNYFDMILPHERTILKWLPKRNDGLTFNSEEDFSGLNSASFMDEQDFIDEDGAIRCFSDVEIDHINGQ